MRIHRNIQSVEDQGGKRMNQKIVTLIFELLMSFIFASGYVLAALANMWFRKKLDDIDRRFDRLESEMERLKKRL